MLSYREYRDTRYCIGCKQRLSKTLFYSTRPICNTCHYAENKAWRKRNPDKLAIQRRRNTAKFHGLTLQEYEQRLKLQNSLCAICKVDLTGDVKACLDHDHVTGKLRFFLCDTCNTALGLFKDNPELLRQAALYLERHNTLSPE